MMPPNHSLEERFINFAVSIIHVCGQLPKTLAGQHLAGQLLRSGLATAPLYVAALHTQDPTESVQKLRLTLKELIETDVWLRLIQRSDMLAAVQLEFVMVECADLSRLISAHLTNTS
jgi:four helix bundle protein